MSTPRPAPGWRDLTPAQRYAVLSQVLLLASSVADLGVALTRAVLGRRGVQTAPALISAGLAAAAPALLLRAPSLPPRVGGPAAAALVLAALTAPALGAVPRATVVGSRNPLWALGLSALARAGAAGVVAALVVRDLERLRAVSGSTPAR